MHGSDLYRLNCQGCHGEAGLGAPPEINSVVGPVRATSVQLVVERMKKTGMDISSSAAGELAKQAKEALLLRLHKGGQDMPPFPHLSDAEIRALLGYLNQLAGVTSARTEQIGVEESPLRVGEHIVKSTCHTCHDAAGPNPTPQQLEEGAIPPLSTLTTRTDQIEFIRKVTDGAPILMGTPPTLHRGKMPVFYYLTKDEAADAYLYLSTYPPLQIDGPRAAIALSQETQDTAPPALPAASATVTREQLQGPRQGASTGSNFALVSMLMGMGMFVVFLILGAMGVAIYVFLKLWEYGQKQPAMGHGFHTARSRATSAGPR
jgi:mono/diheme cytochrome c family protein